MALTKVSTGVVDMSGSTGALEIAKGATTAVVAPLGTLRANTTTNKMEVYASTGWRVLKEGGNVIVPPLTVDYLVIAGGGGGGSWTATSNVGTGGGGGAGGFRTSWTGQGSGGGCASEATPTLATNTSYDVTVGAGGAGQPFNTSTQNNGVNSEFNGIVSNGGGAGGSYYLVNANSGGSGGGAGYGGSGGQYTACQGNRGGNYGPNGSPYRHGGGGGAAGSGQGGGYNGTGAGGFGLRNSITGASPTPYYAGGGGGGVSYVTSVSPGGSAVGGSGGNQNLNATNPTVNTGSGGGGAGKGTQSTVTTPSAGADGVVILRYPTGYSIAVTGSLFRSNATVGSDIVTTFISGTGTITFS